MSIYNDNTELSRFYVATFKLIEDSHKHKSREIVEAVANMLGLPEEDKQEKLPSQTQAT